MQTYQNMKDSGVAWLGEIPSEWTIARPRNIFHERRQKSVNGDTHLTPSQKFGVLPQSEYMEKTGNRVVLNLTGSDNMKRVEKGDFVIHLRSFQGGIEYSPYTGKVSNAYTVLAPITSIYSGYFKHVLKSYGYISDLASTTDQLRDGQSIKFSTFDLVKLPLPDPQTQQRIADYLDAETAKIDHLIARQERLLELLEEKRRATITHAVTRGLNPNAELKETFVPWLGKVPIHWKMEKLKYVGKSIIGLTYSPSDLSEEGTLVLRSMNISDGRINTDTKIFVSKDIPKKLLTREGDLLICSRNGSRKLIGKCGLISGSQTGYTFGVFNTIFRSRYNSYIYYILNSNIFYAQLGLFMTSTINQLTVNTLDNFEIALPPEHEQSEIVGYLEEHEEKLSRAKNNIRKQITLLKERRTSLIAHVVTGKVKV